MRIEDPLVMGGSLLHGLPLMDLPNIYIYISFEIITYKVFFGLEENVKNRFETMHLSERLHSGL